MRNVERQEMRENTDPFGLPILKGDAASRSARVRREVAIECEWDASTSARGRTGGAG